MIDDNDILYYIIVIILSHFFFIIRTKEKKQFILIGNAISFYGNLSKKILLEKQSLLELFHLLFPTMTPSKKKYFVHKIFNFIYITFCVVGLLWQILQISLNYFQFDVVTDIKIIMPEDNIAVGNISLSICIPSEYVLNRSIFQQIESKYENKKDFRRRDFVKTCLNIGDRFNESLRGDEIFSPLNNLSSILENIYQGFNCYVFESVKTEYKYFLNTRIMNDPQFIWIQISRQYPPVDGRLVAVFDEMSTDIKYPVIESNTYFISKLSSPYIDKCINYGRLGMINRKHAIDECLNEKVMRMGNKVPYASIVWKENVSLFNYGQEKVEEVYVNECKNQYSKYDDCHSEIVFTYVSIEKNPSGNNTGKILLWIDPGHIPSYGIKSKPRIDPIDFVTYIFGALGSWLGFSFLACNPIPYLLRLKTKASPGDPKLMHNNACATTISKLEVRLKRLENFLSRLMNQRH